MVTQNQTEPVIYNGNGSVTNFSVPFRFTGDRNNSVEGPLPDHLRVRLQEQSGGSLRDLRSPDDFSLTGNIHDGISLVLTQVLATDQMLVIERDDDLGQDRSFRDAGRFPARVVESAFQQQSRVAQDTRRQAQRALRVSPLDHEMDMELPPLTQERVIPVFSKDGVAVQSASDVEALAGVTEEIVELSKSQTLAALQRLSQEDVIELFVSLSQDRDEIIRVSEMLNQIRTLSDTNYQNAIDILSDENVRSLIEEALSVREVFQGVNEISGDVARLGNPNTRDAIETLASEDVRVPLQSVAGNLNDVMAVAARAEAISEIVQPQMTSMIDAVIDPQLQARNQQVLDNQENIQAVAGLEDGINALATDDMMSALAVNAQPESQLSARIVQQNIQAVRGVSNVTQSIVRVDDGMKDLLSVPNEIDQRTNFLAELASDPRLLVAFTATGLSIEAPNLGEPSDIFDPGELSSELPVETLELGHLV